jgi:hypothetical protein
VLLLPPPPLMIVNLATMYVCLFLSSTTRTTRPFELIHCDLWTSPVLSNFGFKYFLVILDDFTHFLWTVPLHQKSDAYASLTSFRAYTHTQFNLPLASI